MDIATLSISTPGANLFVLVYGLWSRWGPSWRQGPGFAEWILLFGIYVDLHWCHLFHVLELSCLSPRLTSAYSYAYAVGVQHFPCAKVCFQHRAAARVPSVTHHGACDGEQFCYRCPTFEQGWVLSGSAYLFHELASRSGQT